MIRPLPVPSSRRSPVQLMPLLYMMSNSATRKGGRDLVLDDTGADAAADHFRPLFEGFDAAEVYADGAVELEGATAGGDFRAAEHDADLLSKLVDEDDGGVGAVDGGRELAEGLGHEAGLQADVGVAHVALDFGAGNEGGDAVDDDDLDGAAADQVFGDFEGLLGVVGLGYEERIHVDAAVGGIDGVEGMFNVDVGGDAALPLALGHDVDGQGGLAGGLRAVDFGDAAFGDAADAEGYVEGEGAGGDDFGRVDGVGLAEPHDGAAAVVSFYLIKGYLQGVTLLFSCHFTSSV